MEKIKEQCPRCVEEYLHQERARNALSRRDNKTYICSHCGEREAFVDFYPLEEIPKNQLYVERTFHHKIGKNFDRYVDWKKKIRIEMAGL